jgi:hypothetical protein
MCTFVAKTNSENNPNQRYLQLGLASPELITFVWEMYTYNIWTMYTALPVLVVEETDRHPWHQGLGLSNIHH